MTGGPASLASMGLAALLATGCASYSIQPAAHAIVFPARVPKAIPVKVAIVRSAQDFPRDAGDQALELSQRLEESGLFEAVYYPLRPTDRPDATMELEFTCTTHVPDGSELKNALNLGTFYMTSGLLKLYCEFRVDVNMVLSRGTEIIKTYSTQGKALLSFKMEMTPAQALEATQAAGRAVQARLIEQLIQDHDFLEAKLGAPRTTESP